jgi:hypothetical protein
VLVPDAIKKNAWEVTVGAYEAIKKVLFLHKPLPKVLNKVPGENILMTLVSLAHTPLTYMWILGTIVI